MNSAMSSRQLTYGFSNRPQSVRPLAMKAEKPSGSPWRKAIHRAMSTPPNSQAVFMQWCASFCSMSLSKAAPARAKMSPSPVASITTLARIAMRPSLLSKITPATAPFSISGTQAHEWYTSRTPRSSTISCEASLSRSGSMVGDQVTMPCQAAVRMDQWRARSASWLPHSGTAGPATAWTGRRPSTSSAKPRMTSSPAQSVMRSIQITRPPVAKPPRWL
ncbi:hypothetical protein D9M68_793190 [compost metagenome]